MPVTFTYRRPKIDARPLVAAASVKAVGSAAKQVLDAALEKTPEDTGRLKASGRVEQEGPHAYVTFGRDDDGDTEIGGFAEDGAATPGRVAAPSNDYVVEQHENYELDHPGGGEAGFLIKPFHSEKEHIAEALAVVLRKVFM